MSVSKKSFSQFLRPAGQMESPPAAPPPPPSAQTTELPLAAGRAAPAGHLPTPAENSPSPAGSPQRIRQVTATGRVRTYSANRALPGVTLRLPEERWERLKMLSIQERRPIQDILGEAIEGFMRARGLPW